MAYMITDVCVACGACEHMCPVHAISEGDQVYEIDPSKCVECVGHYNEPQCYAVCPVEAPVPNPNHPRKD